LVDQLNGAGSGGGVPVLDGLQQSAMSRIARLQSLVPNLGRHRISKRSGQRAIQVGQDRILAGDGNCLMERDIGVDELGASSTF
jgi:hypothetical protein